MRIIRKILILTINTDWGADLKQKLTENSKVQVDIASIRTTATKLMTENHYTAVIMEDTFKVKNLDYFLRLVSSQNIRPKFVYFCFSDIDLYKTINIPENLNGIEFRAHSLPLPKELLQQIIYEEIFPYGAESKGDFDREFIQVLINSAKKVLTSFGLEDVKAKKPELLSKMDELDVGIRAKIIIKSDYFKGSMLVSFPEQAYKNLYKKVVGQDIEKVDEKNTDFAGELANIIYGQSKKELEEHGVKLDMAIPILDRTGKILSQSAVYVIPIESSVGEFYLKLAPNYFN